MKNIEELLRALGVSFGTDLSDELLDRLAETVYLLGYLYGQYQRGRWQALLGLSADGHGEFEDSAHA